MINYNNILFYYLQIHYIFTLLNYYFFAFLENVHSFINLNS